MRCAECGAEVPILREFCTNCGAPTDPGLRERRHRLSRGPRPDDEPKSGGGKAILIAGAALLGLAAVGGSWFDFDSDDRPDVVVQERGPVTIEADELYRAYRDTPEAAAERFGGREMVVSGEFVRIVPDGYGSLDLRLKTSDRGAQVGVDLAELAIEDGKKLVPGQRVTVSCQGMGEGADELWVRECAVQPMAETIAAPVPPSEPTAPTPPAAPAAENEPE